MEWLQQMHWGYILTVVTTMGGYLLALLLIPRIIMDRRGAEATLAWILLIAFLPYLGAAAYYLIGRRRFRRRAKKRRLYRQRFQNRVDRLGRGPSTPLEELKKESGLVRLAESAAEEPLTAGNQVQIFTSGQEALQEMAEAIEKAEHHVNLMSYIIREDVTGSYFMDLLKRKVQDGVEVRVLADGWGSYGLSSYFLAPFLRAGGRFAFFGPLISRRSHFRPHMRNHRKILVVDGLVGFTGGLNIGDEYRGRKKHLAPWRDTHLRLEGPAVQTLQEIFIEDWFYADGEDMIDEAYFPPPQTAGEDVVQVAASGPDLPKSPIHRIFFTAVNQAQKTVRITTPYFVPDPALLMALKTAVWRGVKVEVLLPGKSDLPLVAMAGRSYYKELLEDDVVVYELRPGVLHAKTMVVDGKWSTVGSANMDIRSFQLNFEVNVMIWGESFAARLEDIFNQDLAASQRVTEARINNRSWPRKASEAVIRVLSPVL